MYGAALFAVLALITLSINLIVPGLRRRRAVAGVFSRLFFAAAGIDLAVQGIEKLPAGPCIVVANHASYVDGIVAVAALPPEFAFVIKKEMARVPLAAALLKRLGSVFVERFKRHEGAADARRVLRLAAAGQSLVFFPEGTFDARRQIGHFVGGAFIVAERSGLPVVAAAVHGTRQLLPVDSWMLHRCAIRFEILAVLEPATARLESRELIGAALREPLAP